MHITQISLFLHINKLEDVISKYEGKRNNTTLNTHPSDIPFEQSDGVLVILIMQYTVEYMSGIAERRGVLVLVQ